MAFATRAEAGAAWATSGASARETAVRTFVSGDHGVELLVEEVELEVSAPRIAWIRAFPEAPKMRGLDARFFPALDGLTEVQPPYHEGLEEKVFGPSILNWIAKGLLKDPPAAPEPVSPPNTRRVYLGDREVQIFSGKTWTSTKTHRRYLPTALETWLQENDFKPNDNERAVLSNYCDQGWIIAGTLIENPSRATHITLGPTLYRFHSERLVQPVLLDVSSGVPRDGWLYYFGADRALEIQGVSSEWDARPWDGRVARPKDRLIVRYSHQADDVAGLEIQQMLGDPVADVRFVTRGRVESSYAYPNDLRVITAKEPVVLPPSNGRGSTYDILLCLLLGVTPLLYSPESWILLLIAARAREKQRADKTALGTGTLLWPIYALLVAAFWIVRLEGKARFAALVPLFIGILQLATPPPERERGQVRVNFERRRKKPKADAPDAKSAAKSAK
jgi:hypothetical protein